MCDKYQNLRDFFLLTWKIVHLYINKLEVLLTKRMTLNINNTVVVLFYDKYLHGLIKHLNILCKYTRLYTDMTLQ